MYSMKDTLIVGELGALCSNLIRLHKMREEQERFRNCFVARHGRLINAGRLPEDEGLWSTLEGREMDLGSYSKPVLLDG